MSTNRYCQCIDRIVLLWQRAKLEECFDHLTDLWFGRMAIGGETLLYFERCVFGQQRMMTGYRQEYYSARMRDSDAGRDVLGKKDLFDRHERRFEFVQDLFKTSLQEQEAVAENLTRAAGDAAAGDIRHNLTVYANDGITGICKTRVDAEDRDRSPR